MSNGSAAAHNWGDAWYRARLKPTIERWFRHQVLPAIGRRIGAQTRPFQQRIERLERQIGN